MTRLVLTADLAGLKYFVPRLKIIWADQAYRGHNLADWCRSTGDWKLEVVKRTPGVRGWSRAPKTLDCGTYLRLVASQSTAGRGL